MTTKTLDLASDAAALILAAINEDDGMVQAVILDAAQSGTRELAKLLHWTVTAAAEAIRADLLDAAERGEHTLPSVSYIVALAGHAHRSDQ